MKNVKLNKKLLRISLIIWFLVFISMFVVYNTQFPGESVTDCYFVWVHKMIFIIDVLFFGFMTITTITQIVVIFDRDSKYGILHYILGYDNNDGNNEKDNNLKINWKKWIRYIILILILFYTIKISYNSIKQCIKVYNYSKLYHNTYNIKCNERIGFYDKLWKTYLQKEKITNVNKDVFIQVSKIIMENRRDGEKITWKWLQENQQIPYSEFTNFYKDLSSFITQQREEYFKLEKECQLISNQNNILLDTFPNNFYNQFLKCKHIEFEYGFTSDSTEQIFKNKKENLK